jgi:hypothetical protein
MSALAPAVYILCLVSSAVCAWLLIRSYLRNQTRFLLWTACCFALLAANNLAVVVDLLLVSSIDLRIVRHLFSLGAVAVLIHAFVYELD